MKSPKVQAVLTATLNLSLLPHVVDGVCTEIGVRAIPYGRGANKNTMILAVGPTLDAALEGVYDKAQADNWERLDWAARPWPQGGIGHGLSMFDGPVTGSSPF